MDIALPENGFETAFFEEDLSFRSVFKAHFWFCFKETYLWDGGQENAPLRKGGGLFCFLFCSEAILA